MLRREEDGAAELQEHGSPGRPAAFGGGSSGLAARLRAGLGRREGRRATPAFLA